MPRLAAALAIGVLALVWLVTRALAPRDFAGDEAAKVSESYYFGLPPSHPDWLRSPIERSNPPFGKYVFGAAIRLSGNALPPDPELAWNERAQRYDPPPGREALYRAAVRPARVASAIAMAAVFALVVWLAWGWSGPGAASIAVILLWRHFLTPSLGGLATFDALQTMLILGAIALLVRPDAPRAIAAGALIALAFQTRLNGILALAPALLLVVAPWGAAAPGGAAPARAPAPHRAKHAVLLLASFAIVTIAVNPIYWTPHLLARIRMQLSDVDAVLATLHHDLAIETFSEKATFFFSVASSGIAGKLILAGAVLSLLSRERTSKIAALTLAAAFLVWLPVRWERYVFPTLPLLACLAGIGLSAAAARARGSIPRRIAPTRNAAPLSHRE